MAGYTPLGPEVPSLLPDPSFMNPDVLTWPWYWYSNPDPDNPNHHLGSGAVLWASSTPNFSPPYSMGMSVDVSGVTTSSAVAASAGQTANLTFKTRQDFADGSYLTVSLAAYSSLSITEATTLGSVTLDVSDLGINEWATATLSYPALPVGTQYIRIGLLKVFGVNSWYTDDYALSLV